jgi:hypothetical protein
MKVNYKNVQFGKNSLWLVLDSVMLLLIVLNLSWMIFDFLFTAHFFQVIIEGISSKFFIYYRDVVHPDFLLYDLGFVLIFLVEFIFRWIVAIAKKTYSSWVSFPFIFWYDLLGCIPLASFRFLRLFRIVTLIVRLQKREIIDVTDTWWYKFGNKNYQKVLEEISDRVSTNILTGIQKEIKYGDDTNKRIVNEVLVPRQEEFAVWIASRMKFAVNETYESHKLEIREYLEDAINTAVKNNEEIARLELIPLFGKQISKALSSSISDISVNLIDTIMKDLADEQMHTLVSKAVDISVKTALYESENEEIEKVSKRIVYESIEVLKSQVNKKHHGK